MDPRLEPLATVLELNTRLFHNCLEEMSDVMGRARVDGRTNPASFIALHLLDARAYLARMLGGDGGHPWKGEVAGVTHVDEVARLPALEELRAAWDEVSRRLEPLLERLGPDELEAVPGQPFPVDDESLLGAVAFLVQHESYHVGQLALLRKHHGLPAMTYR